MPWIEEVKTLLYNKVKWTAITFPSSKSGLHIRVLEVWHHNFPLQNYRFSNCDCSVGRCAFGQTTAASNYQRAGPRSQQFYNLHCTLFTRDFSLHTSSLTLLVSYSNWNKCVNFYNVIYDIYRVPKNWGLGLDFTIHTSVLVCLTPLNSLNDFMSIWRWWNDGWNWLKMGWNRLEKAGIG